MTRTPDELSAKSLPISRAIDALGTQARVRVTGVRSGARGHLLARVLAAGHGPVLAVAADEEAADALADDLAFFLGGAGTRERPVVLRLPDDEAFPFDELSPNRAVVQERLAALFHLRAGTPSLKALVLSARGLARKQLPPARLDALTEKIRKGQSVDRDELARRLVERGFQSAPVVEDAGTFSVRGGLLDVWSPAATKPARLEFFGDEVESLKSFDPETQRTIEELDELALCPATELLFSDEGKKRARAAALEAADAVNRPTSKTRELLDAIGQGVPAVGLDAVMPRLHPEGLAPLSTHLDAMGRKPLVFIDDPLGVQRALEEFDSDLGRAFAAARSRGEIALEPREHYLAPDAALKGLEGRATLESLGLYLRDAGPEPLQLSLEATTGLREAIVSHHGEDGALSPLVEKLRGWRDAGLVTAIACGSVGGADKLKRLLLDRNTMVKVHSEPFPASVEALRDPSVWAHLFPGDLSGGFVDRGGALAVLSDEEIFGARQRRRARARRIDPALLEFRELTEGDLVVHLEFGIGKYLGLVKKELAGIPGDFLLLEYAGGDKVYLPIHRLRQVQKFVGGDADKVKLDKLGGTAWEKTKRKVKEELLKMAGDLLRIYAARTAHPGIKFSEPDRYYRQFEADFEFEPTVDQQKAIDDVLADMTTGKVMDRLICGDVGYGKTEVALRAAFKAVLDKKQVAVLVPTTVLAAQHFLTFSKRFKDYPVRVEMVSRYRKNDEIRDVLRRLASGHVDVVVGTHRLLGKDVAFKDLGLLVVDEEQRFGVKHKEELKKLRTQVGVLTLSATPIPRTLHMSMAGVRDMTIIATPPADRKSIRTIVQKYDPQTVAESISRELARGGQVYYVHNRVESMPATLKTLQQLVPKARIGVAHGQMPEGELEDVMTAFVEKQFDVLLCSTIIESGLDIPSANTLIVERADMFGLAQLYQLRGRVGRSAARAYAYLLVPSERAVTPDAVKRLEVLQQFSELGAGFAIASHDLEIRGAGNLLGAEQAGTIAAVGFDLYAQLLDEAVRELRGEPPRQDVEPEVTLSLPAFIPEEYVPDVHQRLVLYKRFSDLGSDDELADLRAELIDRFGETPIEVDNLSELTLIKIDLRELRVRALESGPARVVITLGQQALLDPAKTAAFIQKSKGEYKLTPDMKLVARINSEAKDQDLIAEAKRVVRQVQKLAAD
ncbi:MAG: transcription-repair coupling factor [Deltaproteobacteria bacterium]|nr:transcription-repair coupling factor [Deltaproteobacteria bacterium]